MNLAALSIGELRARMTSGDVTPVDAVNAVFASIDDRNDGLNAYLSLARDHALAEAKRQTDSGDFKNLPLGGVPVAVKDNICVQGGTTTCGSKILEHYQPPYTATAVERLRAAGAIVVGKTNCDEFAMGSSNENSAFGPSRNPWNPEKSPGGSSGGSAVAVAADMAFAALGSDTGGSIRQPASFCGCVGMKPTYGRVSRYGLVAFASSLDQIGPFARTVDDAARVLQAMAGKDERDATSLDKEMPSLSGEFTGGTVGVPWRFLEGTMRGEVKSTFEATLSKLEAAGMTIKEVELPNANYGVAAYYVLANAEASANLARFDGIRYGHRSANAKTLVDTYTLSREEGFGPEVKRRILLGTYVLSAGYYEAYYHQAQKVRTLICRDFDRAFADCDVIALPTAPTPAFGIGEKVDDPVTMYLSDVFTIPVNLAGLPGLSLPMGLSEKRLPLGFQLIAPALAEDRLFAAGRVVEAAIEFGEKAYA